MKTISRYIMTLALLLTAVGGAWADEVKYPIVYDFEAAANASEDPSNKNGSEVNGQKFYGWENETYTDRDRKDYKGYIYAEGSKLPEVCHVWLRSDHINGNVAGNGGLKCPSNREMAVDGLTEGLTVTIIYDATNATDKEIVWAIGDGSSQSLGEPRAKAIINGAEAVPGTTTIKSGDVITVTKVTPAVNGSGYIVFKVMKDMVIKKIIIDEAKDPNTIEVTTNAASKQDLFTEASFTMPPFDATVNYMLVRDMQDETNPVTFSGLPTTGDIIVKKGDDGKYQPAEALTIQLIDPLAAAEAQNIIAADGITVKVLVGNGGTPIEYDQENPITLEAFLADMKPGYYWIKAEQTDENSPYDGTVYSSEFTVVEQYDLLVKPANDFSKGKIESVTVGSGSVTLDANTGKATKTGIDPDTEVKVKAKRGYVIDKVEAKKGIAPPDPVTVTWNNLNFNSNPYTRDGVTLTTTGNAASANNFNNGGDKTFTTTLGKFTKIEIVCESNNFNGWAKEQTGGYQVPEGPYVEVFKLTWTGNAESVTIPGGNYLYGISSITFTIQ